jgi:hypothetical protein
LCGERRLALKDRDQRENLACEVIEAFQNGLTDEAELWRALSRLISRASSSVYWIIASFPTTWTW